MSDSEDPLPLIRTGFRDKLPRGLSHPVDAEVISRAGWRSPWCATTTRARGI